MQLAMTSAPQKDEALDDIRPQKDEALDVIRPTKGMQMRSLPPLTPIEKLFPKGSIFFCKNYSLLSKIIYRE